MPSASAPIAIPSPRFRTVCQVTGNEVGRHRNTEEALHAAYDHGGAAGVRFVVVRCDPSGGAPRLPVASYTARETYYVPPRH